MDFVNEIEQKDSEIMDINLNGCFGYVNQRYNPMLRVDGYTQIPLNCNRYGVESEYYHNYVTKNGESVFEDYVKGAYIGRNIFLCMDQNPFYYIYTPGRVRRLIECPHAFDGKSFEILIEEIVKELNMKYFMEVNGIRRINIKYTKKRLEKLKKIGYYITSNVDLENIKLSELLRILRGDETILKTWFGMPLNVKEVNKSIHTFVKEISVYDEAARWGYEYDRLSERAVQTRETPKQKTLV